MSMQNPAEPDEINGMFLFPPGEPIRLPEGLPPIPMNVYSESGFKIRVLNEGEPDEQKVWVVASEEDYQEVLERLWGSTEMSGKASSMGFDRPCSLWNGVCPGVAVCAGLNQCWGVYSPGQGLIGCVCR